MQGESILSFVQRTFLYMMKEVNPFPDIYHRAALPHLTSFSMGSRNDGLWSQCELLLVRQPLSRLYAETVLGFVVRWLVILVDEKRLADLVLNLAP